MHSLFSFIRLDNERDIFLHDLDRFAASFDHQIVRLFPIWVVYYKKKPIAYSYTPTQVVAYQAVHPSISPRDFYRLSWIWFSHLKTQYGNPIILTPPDWTEKLLNKVGLEKMDHNIYKIRD